ncbi:MAG: acylneuraminate cytidylyltransferase family protein [Desulfobacterales bacterium]|nr:acylneuraminate cytidylyltransferase family protein [Desulfobacterales bacterium]
MINGKSVLAIIPARGGSKGLPGKNVRELCGKPLIAWSIEQALGCGIIDRVVVSTDDDQIADVAKTYGAEVPFIRPVELASDMASIIDVIFHTIDWFEKYEDYQPAYILLLQPTSPLRISEDIDNAIELLFARKAQTIVSVCETEHHPYGANMLPADGNMRDFLRPEVINKNRQELPTFYRINGAIYLAYRDYLKTRKTFFGNDTYAYVMPRERSIDIDSKVDFEFAEYLLKVRKDEVQ